MIEPHSSCRYAVGIHGERTFIGAVHAIHPDRASLLVSRVDSYDTEDAPTRYSIPFWMEWQHLAAMAPNLGEARKLLKAMQEAQR